MSYAKSEKTRQRLLDSTARLLRIQGYAATGLADITADSGLPKGSLYHHFPGGKEALAAEAIRYSGSGIRVALEQLLTSTGGPIEAIEQFCDYYIGQLEGSGYRRGCPLATVALEAPGALGSVQEACADAFSEVLDLLAGELAKLGIAARVADDLALFVVSAIEGALVLAKAQRSPAPLRIARHQLSITLQHARDAGASP